MSYEEKQSNAVLPLSQSCLPVYWSSRLTEAVTHLGCSCKSFHFVHYMKRKQDAQTGADHRLTGRHLEHTAASGLWGQGRTNVCCWTFVKGFMFYRLVRDVPETKATVLMINWWKSMFFYSVSKTPDRQHSTGVTALPRVIDFSCTGAALNRATQATLACFWLVV